MIINRNHGDKIKDRALTAQRRLLLDTLRTVKGHLDARELYRRASEKGPRISIATVYRNLHRFSELGLVDERRLGQAHCCYEIKRSMEHYHLVCEACGRVIEFESPLVGKLIAEMQHKSRFVVNRVVLYLEGYCPQCKGSGKA